MSLMILAMGLAAGGAAVGRALAALERGARDLRREASAEARLRRCAAAEAARRNVADAARALTDLDPAGAAQWTAASRRLAEALPAVEAPCTDQDLPGWRAVAVREHNDSRPATWPNHRPRLERERGSVDLAFLLVAGGALLALAWTNASRLAEQQEESLRVFGPREDGPAYCAGGLVAFVDARPESCIPERSDHGAPGRGRRAPDAVCALITLSGRPVSTGPLGEALACD